MSGLNKLVEKIKATAENAARDRLEQAKQQAHDLLQQAKEDAEHERKRILQEAEVKAADSLERAESSAALQKQRAILSAKQQIIGETIQKARETLRAMPADEYFDLIGKMVSKYALPQSGYIIFSQQDRNRLPADFEKRLNQELLSNGGALTISSENRPIDGGFVLVYGDVEENCTFDAIFSSKHDILLDKVHEFLFE
jgi:V/A-type H+-transporting ATPase subunit E